MKKYLVAVLALGLGGCAPTVHEFSSIDLSPVGSAISQTHEQIKKAEVQTAAIAVTGVSKGDPRISQLQATLQTSEVQSFQAQKNLLAFKQAYADQLGKANVLVGVNQKQAKEITGLKIDLASARKWKWAVIAFLSAIALAALAFIGLKFSKLLIL